MSRRGGERSFAPTRGDDRDTPQRTFESVEIHLAQHRFNVVHQVVLAIGLPKDSRFAELLKGVDITITSDEYDRQSGPRGVNGFCKLNSIHFRHSEVCKDEIYFRI